MSFKKHSGQEEGSSHVYHMTFCDIKRGEYVILSGCPCKVLEIWKIRTGRKHGQLQIHIMGVDIFSGILIDGSYPPFYNMEIPFVKINEFQLIDIAEDGYVTLLLKNGETKEDLKLPNEELELSRKIREDFIAEKDLLISVISAMGQEKIISYKEANSYQN